MSDTLQLAKKLSFMFSSIYFHCHPTFEVELSHQAVRALQYVRMTGPATIQQIAAHLGCAHNTASEIVRRLRQKGLVKKDRRGDDERIVEVSLTNAGYEAVLQHTGLDVQRLAHLLEHASPDERQEMARGLSLLLQAVGGRVECS